MFTKKLHSLIFSSESFVIAEKEILAANEYNFYVAKTIHVVTQENIRTNRKSNLCWLTMRKISKVINDMVNLAIICNVYLAFKLQFVSKEQILVQYKICLFPGNSNYSIGRSKQLTKRVPFFHATFDKKGNLENFLRL